MWERRERFINEHVQRTHGESQRGVGLRAVVGGGSVGESGGGKMETTVFKQE